MEDSISYCYEKVMRGEDLSKEEAMALTEADLQALCEAADRIRRSCCGNEFDMCSVLSIRGGRCSENCRFCPQASCSTSLIRTFPLLEEEAICADARRWDRHQVRHYCLVSSGRRMSEEGIRHVCRAVRRIRQETGISPCVSLGLLTREDMRALREAGVTRIHNNLETSLDYFPVLCTSHTYEEKLRVIREAHEEGLEVCSGGIIGAGESWEDRIALAICERELGTESIPVNMLHPYPGSPLGDRAPLEREEVLRVIAIFRFLLPDRYVRLAAGRDFLEDGGMSAFSAGSNASITGNMLNIHGISVEEDLEAVRKRGYSLVRPHRA